MKKSLNIGIASLLALGITANVCAPQIFDATTAFSATTATAEASAGGSSSAVIPEKYKASDVSYYIEALHDYFTAKKYSNTWDWLLATYHLGNLEAYKATGIDKFYEQTYDIAASYDWKVYGGNKTTVLDSVATSMVLCMLHSLTSTEYNYKLDGVKDILDYNGEYGMVDYSWVDEIYMGGLAHTYLSQITGDTKYSETDFSTYSYYRQRFFDEETWLWFRDWTFVPGTGSNWENHDPGTGELVDKQIWSRGNAWVYVSLAQRMEYMDKNDPAYETYKADFLMMSEGLRAVQREDGLWNVNLGDADHKAGKEMTGTAGFVYGMCVGIELGLLDSAVYVPVVTKAYDTITTECIFAYDEKNIAQTNKMYGFLGYCQPPAGSPSSYTTEERVKHNMDEDETIGSSNSYGVGLAMMALSRFMRLCSDYETPTLNAVQEEHDPETNAKYTVIDDGWYKGVAVATTNAGEYTSQAYNGVANVMNGNWIPAEENGAYFRGLGLKMSTADAPLWVEIAFDKTIEIEKIVNVLHIGYQYKYKIMVSTDGELWTTVVDTTTSAPEKAYVATYKFSAVQCNRIRIEAQPYWNSSSTDTFWLREMLVYETKAK